MATDYRTVTVQVSNTLTPNGIRAFGANKRRFALLVSCPEDVTANKVFHISTISGTYFGAVMHDHEGPFSTKLTYRDFGPLLQEEIWISCNVFAGNIANVTLTEIFHV